MKKVKLIKLESSDVIVDDFRNCTSVRLSRKDITPVINSCEFIYERIENETVKVNRVVDHDIEHYIAAESKVWEYLLLIKNPVTVKSLLTEKEKLKNNVTGWRYAAERNERKLKYYLKSIKNTGLLTRIKWVFTGVKV